MESLAHEGKSQNSITYNEIMKKFFIDEHYGTHKKGVYPKGANAIIIASAVCYRIRKADCQSKRYVHRNPTINQADRHLIQHICDD